MAIREQMGMSTRQFAEWLGLSYGAYNEIENLSRYPSSATIELMAQKIGSAVEEAFPEYLREIKSTTAIKTIPEREVLSLQEREIKMLAAPNANDLQRPIAEQLATLSPRKERIVRLYLGFDGPPMTFNEIGRELKISDSRVQQIFNRAIRDLRHPLRANNLRNI